MNNIPTKLRKELSLDPNMHRCMRANDKDEDGRKECMGRVTYEHCWMYAGRQIQEKFAIIPLCIHHHLGSGLNKKKNRWYSINKMSSEDEKKYPKINWKRERIILNKLFKK